MENILKKKSDPCLVHDLKKLVAHERQTLSQILDHLREVEVRRLYLARGYPSLFAWMRSELGYSEASAQRRIAAMRLIKEVPEVKVNLEAGEMSLSVASQVQSYFRKENQKRRDQRVAPLPKAEKLKLLTQLKATSSRECERKLIELNPDLNLPPEKTRPVSPTRSLIQFSADQALMEKIQRLKNLSSHQNPEGSYEKLFEKAVDLALERLDPVRREARRKVNREKRQSHSPSKNLSEDKMNQDQGFALGKARASVQAPGNKLKHPTPLPTSEVKQRPNQLSSYKKGKSTLGKINDPKVVITKEKIKRSRHIPRPLRDYIWKRDQGRCQHRDTKSGKICGAVKFLELDHRYAFAMGGEHSEENLRLLCRTHNRYRSELLFGQEMHKARPTIP